MVRPSGETSTFIHVPLSTLIGIWRRVRPCGALTFHLAGLSGSVAGALAAAGGSGWTGFCSGLITSFSGA
jgi:hypothetical protein